MRRAVIKRDKRNIGKSVVVTNPAMALYRTIGTIKGFRGDYRPGVVVVQVWFDRLGFIEPVGSCNLSYV